MKHYLFNPSLVTLENQSFAIELLNCKNFEKNDRLLGILRGRGDTWLLNTIDKFGVNSVLRHYYRGGLVGKFVKDRYFYFALEKTRGVKEFKLLQELHQLGLPVPQPIAIEVENHSFFCQISILLAKIENSEDLSSYLQHSTLVDDEYNQLGQLIRQLHNQQVHHSDLNIHNILRDRIQHKFWLIDFDKCQIQSGESWKQRNLDRLLRSFKKEKMRLGILFTEKNWQDLLEGYYSKEKDNTISVVLSSR